MDVDRQQDGVVLVTGTDTGVGKTVVTAAIAAAAGAAGQRVAVVKPAQSGTVDGQPSDIDEVTRLAAPAYAVTLAAYPEPLAPLIAAQSADVEPLALADAVAAVRELTEEHDLVLLEGAGGLLVPMGGVPWAPWTLVSLANLTGATAAVVVARAGLGTLNHTELTLQALEREEIVPSIVIGAWPDRPEQVHRTNLAELRRRGAGTALMRRDLVGVVPERAGSMEPAAFRQAAPRWFTPQYYGTATNWDT